MIVREAESRDAFAIVDVTTAGWRVAYRGIFSDAFLEGLAEPTAVGERVRELEERLASPSGDRETLVAEEHEVVIGWLRLVRDGERAEIQAVYVRPGAWGAGVGRALMAEAVSRARRAGCRDVELWTLEGNRRARAVYERLGWVTDGTIRRRDFGGEEADEIRYRLPRDDREPGLLRALSRDRARAAPPAAT